MRVLIDTNILIRMADSSHPSQDVCVSAVRLLRAQSHELVIVPQIVYEFWSVTTRSAASNGLGKSPAYAATLLPRFCRLFRLLRDERGIYESWLQLVTEQEVAGVKSFDARLAAAMRRHQISHLLTLNAGDFRRFAHVSLLDPAAVVQESSRP